MALPFEKKRSICALFMLFDVLRKSVLPEYVLQKFLFCQWIPIAENEVSFLIILLSG